ncbi:hypothetical protein [Bradyrhizobium sp. CCBAU 051011]|uniref:hypothetical protein n=1 Tax=Bradyrhizobium sp. CCBAU 051011 TaxID=858422 RepID=UPI001FEF939D|nr:hypothetical protein [Bradyrhizobium sp. CCBAU 051011]
MANVTGLSVSTAQGIWRAFGLQPHRLETFKLSTDPHLVAKVSDDRGPLRLGAVDESPKSRR